MAGKKEPLQFAECRSLGHEWRKGQPIGLHDDTDWNRPLAGMSSIGIPSNCQNCGTEKVRWITRGGESITRYRHPEGYERHGDEVLTHREWRANYVDTLFSQFAEAPLRIVKPKRTKAS